MEWLGDLLYVCPLLFIAGVIDAIAGGGGLIALPTYLMTGMPVHMAYGCGKLQCSLGSTMAVLRFWKNDVLDGKFAVLTAVAAMAASAVCTQLVLYLDGEIVRRIVLVMLPVAAILILIPKKKGQGKIIRQVVNRKNILLVLAAGLLLGTYDGMFGPGGGTIAIMIFSLLLHYDLRVASANSKMVIMASNYMALLGYLATGNIVYQIAIPATICNMLGNYVGAGLAIKNGEKLIRPLMLVIVGVLIVKIVLG
ncbi:MAG: sulfite exporter TauE/SafE family protein [Peptococcaceae bacterium]